MSTKVEASSPTQNLHSKTDFKDKFLKLRCVNKGFEDTEGISIPSEATNNGYVYWLFKNIDYVRKQNIIEKIVKVLQTYISNFNLMYPQF